jgi:hypothetical protein
VADGDWARSHGSKNSQISTSRLLKTEIFQLDQPLAQIELRADDRAAASGTGIKKFDDQSAANGKNGVSSMTCVLARFCGLDGAPRR